jgi:hypothetical protein
MAAPGSAHRYRRRPFPVTILNFMLAASDHWGPFSPAISHPERVARLRVLRAICQLSVRGSLPLQKALWLAESGETPELEAAMLELDRLPALTRRHVLGSYLKHQTFKTKDGGGPPRNLEGAG